MRFGILSTANIGLHAVVPAIKESEHTVAAIASRDPDRAAEAAEDLDIPESYGSYEALLADAAIDAVYIPLPNALHAEWTRKAADAGLHVLCEKPIAVDADEAATLFDYCDDAGVTLMEAFMYNFHPRTRRLREIVASELGPVRSIESTFTFSLRGDPDDIRLDPELAGGSLMDVGCYAVSAVRNLLGEPDRVNAHAIDSRDCGVDTNFVGRLEYAGPSDGKASPDGDDRPALDANGAHARTRGGFDTDRHERIRVDAENGWLEATDCFFMGAADERPSVTYVVDDRELTETFEPVDHYRLEVEAFADGVERGTDPLVDREESVANMRVIDALAESAARGETVEVDMEE
ncbi:MAG: Gfo/Idh/MocA family protein [Halopenitus sp.]